MSFELYQGKVNERLAGPLKIPAKADRPADDPAGYIADAGLKDAVNVALALCQPLLLTGQPGTGKTSLAASIAWSLRLEAPFKFETKSTSVARDLFYTYDTVGRFHAAQTEKSLGRPVDFITYGALGRAILLTREYETVKELVPRDVKPWTPRRSIVLIDELDKAPRDLPNDILNEIDELYFKIPELQNASVTAERSMSPIVIITSNSEKHLPDAFLRRCVFYDIPFPNEAQLRKIVLQRLESFSHGASPALDGALNYFQEVRREQHALQKPPGTAELIGWLAAMSLNGLAAQRPLHEQVTVGESTLSALLKTAHDQYVGRELFHNMFQQ